MRSLKSVAAEPLRQMLHVMPAAQKKGHRLHGLRNDPGLAELQVARTAPIASGIIGILLSIYLWLTSPRQQSGCSVCCSGSSLSAKGWLSAR